LRLTVDTDIPAGNAIIEAVEADLVRLRPDVRDTTEPWFWWHVRARGCAGRRLRLVFSAPNSLTVRGAAVSADAGLTWAWLPEYDPAGWEFSVEAGRHDELRLALAPPYTRENLDRWLAGHDGNPALTMQPLCRSRQGRSVPLLRCGRLDGAECRQAVLTARHHACESLASWALEGLLDAVLAGDATGEMLRQRWQFFAVPIVDADGVEAGDQGKRRAPHDHNGDYTDHPIYPETAAIQALARQRLDERLTVALDLHCPWVRGHYNEHIYIVGSPDPDNWRRQQQFAAVLERVRTGPLPYRADGTLPYGQAWNVGDPSSPRMSCSRWMTAHAPGAPTVASFELPYANAGGVTVTPETARAFGRDLARAIAELDR
jgi:hypothetical protein